MPSLELEGGLFFTVIDQTPKLLLRAKLIRAHRPVLLRISCVGLSTTNTLALLGMCLGSSVAKSSARDRQGRGFESNPCLTVFNFTRNVVLKHSI